MYDQQRLRPACAYAQSDQSISLSLEDSMWGKLLTEQHLEFLSLKGGCTGSSESTLMKMPHCWKSHVAAHTCPCLYLYIFMYLHPSCVADTFTSSLYKYLGSTANFCSEFFRVLIVLPLPGLAVFRGGSRMSEKGVQMCNGREGVVLLILSHSSPVSHKIEKNREG